MKIIERSEYIDEDGNISLENRVRATLDLGFSWYNEMQAQEIVTRQFDQALPVDHVLIRNLRLPRSNIIAPLVYLAPQGVRVLFSTPVRGVFRAKGEEWQSYNNRARTFSDARPNLQEIALGTGHALLSYLKKREFPLPEIESVLIFTNPRTHVDSIRPRTRIVLRDGIEHFAANILQINPIMDREDIDAVVDALLNPPQRRSVAPPSEDAFATPPPSASDPDQDEVYAADPFQMSERGPSGERPRSILGMSARQWILLGVLAIFNVLIILAFAGVVFFGDSLF